MVLLINEIKTLIEYSEIKVRNAVYVFNEIKILYLSHSLMHYSMQSELSYYTQRLDNSKTIVCCK